MKIREEKEKETDEGLNLRRNNSNCSAFYKAQQEPYL